MEGLSLFLENFANWESLARVGKNDAAIRLDDDYVSTRHARVVSGENGVYLEDLGSTNGSYVNNQRITAPTTITLSDTVRIGRTIMRLEP